jgi:hypothetical protein
MLGPSPVREISNIAIMQSVPVRKWVPDADQAMEDGVWYASVVGDIREYVEIGTEVGERQFIRRMGRSVGVER